MKPRIRYDAEKKRWECSNGKLSTCGYADNPKLAYDLHRFYVNYVQGTINQTYVILKTDRCRET